MQHTCSINLAPILTRYNGPIHQSAMLPLWLARVIKQPWCKGFAELTEKKQLRISKNIGKRMSLLFGRWIANSHVEIAFAKISKRVRVHLNKITAWDSKHYAMYYGNYDSRKMCSAKLRTLESFLLLPVQIWCKFKTARQTYLNCLGTVKPTNTRSISVPVLRDLA